MSSAAVFVHLAELCEHKNVVMIAGTSRSCRNQGPLAQKLENSGSGRLAKSRAVSRRAKAKSLLSNMFKSK
jgi:hypothetical protein